MTYRKGMAEGMRGMGGGVAIVLRALITDSQSETPLEKTFSVFGFILFISNMKPRFIMDPNKQKH